MHIAPFVRRFVAAVIPAGNRVRRLRREFESWTEHDVAGLELYRALIPANGLVFDVGANVGRRVRIFRTIPARVVAIEPQPRCVAVLRGLFKSDHAVAIEATALGPRAGMADIHIADVDTLSTMDPTFAEATQRSGRFAAHRWSGTTRVAVTTLDALVERHGAPDFVKIDVEGFELEVLKGSTKPLRAVSVEFVPELWERSAECVRYLAALGPVETNYSLGESMRLQHSRWIAPEELLAELQALSSRVDLFGDVYVRTRGTVDLQVSRSEPSSVTPPRDDIRPITRLASNVTANLVATVVTVASAVAAVPILVRQLGIASYGLVGFHATLAAVLSAFDLGLTPAVNRECARRAAQRLPLGDYLATTAAVSWAIAIVLGALVAVASPWLARTWLDGDAAAHVVALMGFAIAAQWPASCYRAGLNGLQHQKLASTISAAAAVLRTLGVALALFVTAAQVETYFYLQIAIGLGETFVTRAALRRQLAPSDRTRMPHRGALKGTLGFTAGMAVAGALGLVLTQTDRVVVSRVVPLETFGLYVVAGALAAGVFRVAQAVLGAAVPRFTELATMRDQRTLAQSFRSVAQAVACVVLPIGFSIALLPTAALRGWGQPSEVVVNAAPLTAALVAGAAINCLVHAPYALLLAFGAARFAVLFNAIAIVVFVPTVYFAAHFRGAEGAAYGWLLLDALMFAGPVIALVAHYLPGHALQWLGVDVIVPIIAAAVTPLAIRICCPDPSSRGVALLQLAVSWLLAVLLTALATNAGRRRVAALIQHTG